MHYSFVLTISYALLVLQTALGDLIADLHALNLSSGTEIGSPTPRWSTYDAPCFVVGVTPATDVDVAKIIAYAADSQTPFLSTGGGHGFPVTLKSLRNGIELDLSRFNHVHVDSKANTLTVGGSVRFRDVVEPLGQAQRELSIGSEPCVGMVGAALGGGVSRYNGLHGMLHDSLLSVKMVTANGTIITASQKKNSDLFWAMRGAGFNFGTVIEATFSVYNQTAPQVLNADFLFAPNASLTILNFFKTFENQLPANLAFVLIAGYASELGGSFILVNAVYLGPEEEGVKYIQPLLDASPIRSNLTMIPWASVNAVSFFGEEGANFTCPTNSTHNVYGSAVHRFDIPTFQTFYEDYDNLLSSMPIALAGTVYFIEFFPKQALLATPQNMTAYPWRNITAHLLFNFAYANTTGTLDRKINDFAKEARKNFTAVSGFEKPEIYVLYGHGDEDLSTLYSAQNLPRLMSLKERWDPKNVYRYTYPLIRGT